MRFKGDITAPLGTVVRKYVCETDDEILQTKLLKLHVAEIPTPEFDLEVGEIWVMCGSDGDKLLEEKVSESNINK